MHITPTFLKWAGHICCLSFLHLSRNTEISSVRHCVTVHGTLSTIRGEFYNIKWRHKLDCGKRGGTADAEFSGTAAKSKQKSVLDSSMGRMFKYHQPGVNSIRNGKQTSVKRAQACWGPKNHLANYRKPSLSSGLAWPGQRLCDDPIYQLIILILCFT